jgi:hypothetical protein
MYARMKRRSFLAALGLSALFGKEAVKAATVPAPGKKRRLTATEVSEMASDREEALRRRFMAGYHQRRGIGQPIHLRDMEPIGEAQLEYIRELHWRQIGQFEGINPNAQGSIQ